MRAPLALAVAPLAVLLATGPAAAISVVSLSPTRLGVAPKDTAVGITFDGAVDHASITADTLRVFGKQSGTATGPCRRGSGP